MIGYLKFSGLIILLLIMFILAFLPIILSMLYSNPWLIFLYIPMVPAEIIMLVIVEAYVEIVL